MDEGSFKSRKDIFILSRYTCTPLKHLSGFAFLRINSSSLQCVHLAWPTPTSPHYHLPFTSFSPLPCGCSPAAGLLCILPLLSCPHPLCLMPLLTWPCPRTQVYQTCFKASPSNFSPVISSEFTPLPR